MTMICDEVDRNGNSAGEDIIDLEEGEIDDEPEIIEVPAEKKLPPPSRITSQLSSPPKEHGEGINEEKSEKSEPVKPPPAKKSKKSKDSKGQSAEDKDTLQDFIQKKKLELQQRVKSQFKVAGVDVKVVENSGSDPEEVIQPDSMELNKNVKSRAKSPKSKGYYADVSSGSGKEPNYYDLDRIEDPTETMLKNWAKGTKKTSEVDGGVTKVSIPKGDVHEKSGQSHSLLSSPSNPSLKNRNSKRKYEPEIFDDETFDANEDYYGTTSPGLAADSGDGPPQDRDYRVQDTDFRQNGFGNGPRVRRRSGGSMADSMGDGSDENTFGDVDERSASRRSGGGRRNRKDSGGRSGRSRRRKHSEASSDSGPKEGSEPDGDFDERRRRSRFRNEPPPTAGPTNAAPATTPRRRDTRWSNPIQPPNRGPICKFFRDGYCREGNMCTYSHDLPPPEKKHELCRFYARGFCRDGPQRCPFMHDDYPCFEYHNTQGNCPKGDQCIFSHKPLNDVTRPLFLKNQQSDEGRRRLPMRAPLPPPQSQPPSDQGPGGSSKRKTLLGSAPRGFDINQRPRFGDMGPPQGPPQGPGMGPPMSQGPGMGPPPMSQPSGFPMQQQPPQNMQGGPGGPGPPMGYMNGPRGMPPPGYFQGPPHGMPPQGPGGPMQPPCGMPMPGQMQDQRFGPPPPNQNYMPPPNQQHFPPEGGMSSGSNMEQPHNNPPDMQPPTSQPQNLFPTRAPPQNDENVAAAHSEQKKEEQKEVDAGPCADKPVSFDIASVLRQIRNKSSPSNSNATTAVSEAPILESSTPQEVDESPASPEPHNEPGLEPYQVPKIPQMQIPIRKRPEWKLLPVDGAFERGVSPSKSLVPPEVIQASLSDTNLQSDPRVKKHLSSQFDDFSKKILSSGEEKASPPSISKGPEGSSHHQSRKDSRRRSSDERDSFVTSSPSTSGGGNKPDPRMARRDPRLAAKLQAKLDPPEMRAQPPLGDPGQLLAASQPSVGQKTSPSRLNVPSSLCGPPPVQMGGLPPLPGVPMPTDANFSAVMNTVQMGFMPPMPQNFMGPPGAPPVPHVMPPQSPMSDGVGSASGWMPQLNVATGNFAGPASLGMPSLPDISGSMPKLPQPTFPKKSSSVAASRRPEPESCLTEVNMVPGDATPPGEPEPEGELFPEPSEKGDKSLQDEILKELNALSGPLDQPSDDNSSIAADDGLGSVLPPSLPVPAPPPGWTSVAQDSVGQPETTSLSTSVPIQNSGTSGKISISLREKRKHLQYESPLASEERKSGSSSDGGSESGRSMYNQMPNIRIKKKSSS